MNGEEVGTAEQTAGSRMLLLLCVSLNRSINAFLLVYLSILVSKAVVCTTLKHIWQNREGPNSAWYNQETQKEKDTYLVSPSCPAIYYYNFFFLFLVVVVAFFSSTLLIYFYIYFVVSEDVYRLPLLHGALQLHHPCIHVRHCGDAEVPGFLIYQMG